MESKITIKGGFDAIKDIGRGGPPTQSHSRCDLLLSSIASDHNYASKLIPKTYGRRYCCVVNCHNREGRPKTDSGANMTFYSFAKQNPIQTRQWIVAVNRLDKDKKLWQPSSNSRICSEHFFGNQKSLDPDSPSFVPTIFPTNHQKQASDVDLARFQRRQRRLILKKEISLTEDSNLEDSNLEQVSLMEDLNSKRAEQLEEIVNLKEVLEETLLHERNIPEHLSTLSVQSEPSNPPIQDKSQNICLLESPLQIALGYGTQTPRCWQEKEGSKKRKLSKEYKVKSMRNKITQTNNVKVESKTTMTQESVLRKEVLMLSSYSERQYRAFCGVPRNMLQLLIAKCDSQLNTSRSLSNCDQINVVLIKLKLNLSYDVLGGMFNVTRSTARLVFLNTLELVYKTTQPMVIWFDKTTIQARMPASFKALFPNTRCILDCSELECQRPKTVPLRVQFYSNYKSRFTLKYLVGIAPSGEITFVSSAYGGRTTDTEITVKSGILDLIEPGDVILADKGFPHIETKLTEAGGTLVMPPFKSGNRQFSEQENRSGYESASVRIHVERVIARMKTFEILNYAQTCQLQCYDRILVIVSAFCNILPELIKQDK